MSLNATSISNAVCSSFINLYWNSLISWFFSWKIHRRLASHYHYWHVCEQGALELSACPDKKSDIIWALSPDKTQNISHKRCWCAVPPRWSRLSEIYFQNGVCTRRRVISRTCTDATAALGKEGAEWEWGVNQEGLSLSYNLRVKLGIRFRNLTLQHPAAWLHNWLSYSWKRNINVVPDRWLTWMKEKYCDSNS